MFYTDMLPKNKNKKKRIAAFATESIQVFLLIKKVARTDNL